MQPFGVATAPAANLGDTFVPLGGAALDAVAGLAARRTAEAHPDAEVIDLAERLKRLAARENRIVLRTCGIEDAVFRAMRNHPRPEQAESELRITSALTFDEDGTRVTTIREPAGWAAENGANRELYEAALAARKQREEQEGARRKLPYWMKLRDRASSRLYRWILKLADMRPTTQAGLAAKAAAVDAIAEDGSDKLPCDWHQDLAVSLSRDAVRILGAEADARAEQARQADGGLLSLVARLGSARRVVDEVEAVVDAAYAIWHPVWKDKPAALWGKPTDRRHGLPGPSSVEEDGRRWYDLGDIEKLRAMEAVKQRSGANEGEARRLEIIAASEVWKAACDRVAQETGYDVACERNDEVVDAMLDLEDAIHGTQPTTLAGLVAKARVEVESAERRDIDTVRLDFVREVAAFAPGSAQLTSNIRPAPLPTISAPRYPVGASREDIETYRTFLDMELRYLNWEIYGQTKGRLGYWMDNPAAELHGPDQPLASSRAATVLALLGILPTPGVHGRAQTEGLAQAAQASAA